MKRSIQEKLLKFLNLKLIKMSCISLSMRSYRNMYFQFKTIINMIKKTNYIRKKHGIESHLKKRIRKLCEIKPSMTKKEIDKRIKATYYPNKSNPYMIIHSHIFLYKKITSMIKLLVKNFKNFISIIDKFFPLLSTMH